MDEPLYCWQPVLQFLPCLSAEAWAAWVQAASVLVVILTSYFIARKATGDASALHWTHQSHQDLDSRYVFVEAIECIVDRLDGLISGVEGHEGEGQVDLHDEDELQLWLDRLTAIQVFSLQPRQLKMVEVVRVAIKYSLKVNQFKRSPAPPERFVEDVKSCREFLAKYVEEEGLFIKACRTALPDKTCLPVTRSSAEAEIFKLFK